MNKNPGFRSSVNVEENRRTGGESFFAIRERYDMIGKTRRGTPAQEEKNREDRTMDRMIHRERRCRSVIMILAALLFLLIAGAAAAEERHTVTVRCDGGGFVGNTKKGKQGTITLKPVGGSGDRWTLEELRKLPDFQLECAAMRFTAGTVNGLQLKYALACGETRSDPACARTGQNLWDVTEPVAAWMESPKEELKLIPLFDKKPWGMKVNDYTFSLQITFTTSAELPDFPLDKISYSTLYESSLNLLEEDSPFIAKYDETADSLMGAQLPLGVPYYYAGGTEEKFLRRFYPTTTTRYYKDSHMYLCGLDCVGFTHLVYERCGLERHPSISDLLAYGVGTEILTKHDPVEWFMYLQPGDLIAVQHGTYHILMYLGTMRQFGWNERTAGEAAGLLDEPLVIHCGGNPFYYERYQQYIKEQGFRDTLPPDGGVTVSVIQKTDKDAPHSTDTSWGKHFGWYDFENGKPLLVFPLDDCTDVAWYGPEW